MLYVTEGSVFAAFQAVMLGTFLGIHQVACSTILLSVFLVLVLLLEVLNLPKSPLYRIDMISVC
jgi:hypothetical protein